MEPTFDQVRQELTEIPEELLGLSADAFERRVELKDRQNELRRLGIDEVEAGLREIIEQTRSPS